MNTTIKFCSEAIKVRYTQNKIKHDKNQEQRVIFYLFLRLKWGRYRNFMTKHSYVLILPILDKTTVRYMTKNAIKLIVECAGISRWEENNEFEEFYLWTLDSQSRDIFDTCNLFIYMCSIPSTWDILLPTRLYRTSLFGASRFESPSEKQSCNNNQAYIPASSKSLQIIISINIIGITKQFFSSTITDNYVYQYYWHY